MRQLNRRNFRHSNLNVWQNWFNFIIQEFFLKADPYSILILFFGIVTNMNEFVIYFFSVKLILLAFHFHSAQICKKFFLCCENVFIPFVMLLFVLSHILRVTWHQMQMYSISISMNRETQEKYVTIWQRHRQKKILVKAKTNLPVL